MAGDGKPGMERLSAKQRGFVLDALACRMPHHVILGWVRDQYGISLTKQSLIHYRATHSKEIVRRYRSWIGNRSISELRFVQLTKRVTKYGRMANTAIRQGRFKEASKNIRAIAVETGDLKQTDNVKSTVVLKILDAN